MDNKMIRPEELEIKVTQENINGQAQEEANLAHEIAAPIDEAGDNWICIDCKG